MQRKITVVFSGGKQPYHQRWLNDNDNHMDFEYGCRSDHISRNLPDRIPLLQYRQFDQDLVYQRGIENTLN